VFHLRLGLFSFSFGLRSPGNSRGRRFYFNDHHTAVDTLDKIVPKELEENSAVVAVTAYALANMEPRTLFKIASVSGMHLLL
jgi:hypothetical protein